MGTSPTTVRPSTSCRRAKVLQLALVALGARKDALLAGRDLTPTLGRLRAFGALWRPIAQAERRADGCAVAYLKRRADLDAKRLAIEPADIDTYALPPQQAKSSDTRSRRFVAEYGTHTVELDALPPDVLRTRIRQAIESHIDANDWHAQQRVERLEQETLASITAGMGQKMGLEQ